MTDDRRDDYDSMLHAQGWRMVNGKLTHPKMLPMYRAIQQFKIGSWSPTPTDVARLRALYEGGRTLQAQRVILRRMDAAK